MQRADSLKKTLRLGKQKEKRALEDEMVGWHHQFNGYELGQTLGDGEGQVVLECCSPCGCEGLDMTWQLNYNYSNQGNSSPNSAFT